MKAQTLQVTTPSDREVAFTRTFEAPRRLVFDAFTKPELLKRWLLGPDGWVLDVCTVDLRAGGRYRYEWWKQKTNTRMGMGGEFREVQAPERYVATEVFDDAWYPGEAVGTVVMTEANERTTVVQTVRYESKAARDTAIGSGMESGVAASFDRLDGVLAGAAAGRAERA